MSIAMISCTPQQKGGKREFTGAGNEVRLMILDPGHFHAALVLKKDYKQVDSTVWVYAPDGPEIEDYMNTVRTFNTRPEEPTNWDFRVYKGPDFLEKMTGEKPGNVMVTAGKNNRKTEYIKAAIDAGINVLADKPMAIDRDGFELLKDVFDAAREKGLLLYDIMTERYEITTVLQKELSMFPGVFGNLQEGTPEDPAVTKESVHHFFKYVAGKKIKRPPWFFDVDQQGEGIVDVTTHLVDLIQWECFPGEIIDHTNEVEVLSARRWPTELGLSQFRTVTRLDDIPGYLEKDLVDTVLHVYSNGEINYRIRDVHARVSVIWNYRAPEGGGDTHFSVMKGTRSSLVIRQGKEQDYKPALYVEPADGTDNQQTRKSLDEAIAKLRDQYPGISFTDADSGWQIVVPERYRIGHEAHFGQVMEKYLQYLVDGKLPEWEVPNMITKYYITTKALEMAGH